MQLTFRKVIAPVLLIVCLIYTNPSREELFRGTVSSHNNGWGLNFLSKYITSNLKGILSKEEWYNLGILSFLRKGNTFYHIGIAGFWIEQNYWTTIPAWFLIIQLIWTLIENNRIIIHTYIEFILSSLAFIYLSQIMESKFQNEKFESTFYLLCSLLIYLITQVILIPSGLFNRSQLYPGSMLGGMACAMLVYLTLMQYEPGYTDVYRWNTLHCSYSQTCLTVIILQLLTSRPIGIAGSIAGVIMSVLCLIGLLDERRW